MGKVRKKRDEIDKDNFDLLIPINILELGSDDDPCFGKHHDLMAPECKECGDSEFCSIVKAQGLHKERLDIETKQRFKDIEESDYELIKRKKQAKESIKQYKKLKRKRMKIVLLVSKEFNLSKKIVKEIYDQLI